MAWLALLPLGLAPAMSMAAVNPQGGQVTAGSGHISQSGLTTTIDQRSQNLSLNWQSFDIGAQSTVNFVQPNARSIAVNRIGGNSGSVILGRLNANGQVFLINPNGVLFGQGAQVNVGGLVASTLNVSDSELAGGTRHFSGNGGGSIVNRGTINAAKGGYIALLGPQVTNQGTLNAPGGTAALAGGTAVTLSFDGSRLLSLQVDKSTLNALADNHQLIVADGGQVLMSAGAKDSLLASVVNNSGTIQARTVENRGGKIVLLGGMAAGTTTVAGTLDASAPTGGNGGFIETSAAHVSVADGARITTRAANGHTGAWLIDPNDFTVASSGGNMTGAAVSSALAGNNFEITTASMGTAGGHGDIFVNDAVSWSGNTFTLNAERNIAINAPLKGSGTGKLALKYGQGAVAAGNTANYRINAPVDLAAGNNFSTMLGNDGTVVQYRVITSLGVAGSISGTDLQGINGHLVGNYVLGANIDASATVAWNDNGDGTYAGFAPIGPDATLFFAGILDGLGHTINGVFINRPSTSGVGPFGYIGNTAEIRNIGLTSVNLTGASYVGGLVGYNNGGSISNSYATGQVAGGSVYVGGLVGVNKGSISNSYATAMVAGNDLGTGGLAGYNIGSINHSYATGQVVGSGHYTGGLVAINRGIINDSYATGTVSGGGHAVGGLAGLNGQMAGDAASISNSYASGNVSGAANDVGGLVGESYTDISNSYATGTVSGNAQDVGGLVGIQYNGSISQTYATGAVIGPSAGGSIGGLIGRQNNGTVSTISSSYWDAETTGQASSHGGGTGLTTAALIAALPGGFASSVWGNGDNQTTPYLLGMAGNQVFNLNDLPTGAITPSNRPNLYTVILDVNQLQAVNSGLAGSYVLGNNIDASATSGWNAGEGFVPITGYMADPDPLCNPYCSAQILPFAGIFDGLGHAISNLTINRPTESHLGLFGSIKLGAEVRNLGLIGGSISGAYQVGGLAGENKGTIRNSYATADVNGRSTTGGLVGNNGGTIGSSYATGNINDIAYADVYVISSIGGLVGFNNAVIDSSYSTGNVNGTNYMGGLVGSNEPGGMISNSYATGNVVDDYSYHGNYANGGLVGFNTAQIRNSYAYGSVVDNGANGGVVGYSAGGGTITNSYWNSAANTKGIGTNNNGASATGLTAAQMLDPTSFVAWGADISATGGSNAVWRIYEGHTSPLLKAFMTSLTVTLGDQTTTYNGQAYDGSGLAYSVADPDMSQLLGSFTDGTARNAGSYTLSGSGLYSGQQGYDIVTGGSGTLTIDKATLTLSGLSAADKVYDASITAVATGTLSGVFGSDDVDATLTVSFANKNAGTGKTVTVDGITLGGADVGNYVIAAGQTATADIVAATLTLNGLSATDKTYDASAIAAATGTLSGVFGSDDVDATLAASFADKNAGTGKTVTVDGITLGGADGGNYVIAAGQTTTADIAKRAIIVGATGTDRVYDGTKTDAVSLATTGILGGDTVTFTGTGSFADKNVGTAKALAVTGIAASGADAGNYSFNATASTTATITPATLTYRADGASSWTGQIPGDLSGTVSGLVGGDTLADATEGALTWSTPANAASPAGSYAINGSGLSALNYVFAQAPGNAVALQLMQGEAVQSGAPLAVARTVAGLQQQEDDAAAGYAPHAPYAPSIQILSGGVRLP
ncbi:heme utilization/adhesion protein [Rhodanobacter fulvus Jip2]|uniref:Heme utilization/adhesion protein n=1 Tax=Rhodanobacter fulvus Jip2 TaxID=1163408 RepID=I4VZA7_9GAMM|nr:heme utilization/adhesion protein [Rhodanobacter fulvus Jip2]